MDEPASIRWAKPCARFATISIQIYQNFLNEFPTLFIDILEDILYSWFEKNAIDPYRSEMAYFANCTGIPLGGIIILNLAYDMTAFCTSIIAQTKNGHILHGRNMDYIQVPLLRNATMIAHFTNNSGHILYTAATWFAYTGIWTGVKPNAFSISADQRSQGSLLENIKTIKDDWYPPSWLIRDLLADQNVTTYEQALHMLSNAKLMAPVYFIIGGKVFPNGAVVTRNQTFSFNLWPMKDSYLGWYNVETNYDWWLSAPKDDDRRDVAIQSMNAIGEMNLNAENLYNEVLSKVPVLNNGTLYTTIMSASNYSLFRTMVRIP